MSRLVLVFDLDDTLYPERQFALCGFRAAAAWAEAELGLRGLDADMIRLLDAGYLGGLFAKVLEDRRSGQHSPGQVQGLIAAYRSCEPELSLFGDARWALENYGRAGPLGLITDGTHAMQQKKVRALELEPRFRTIIYTDLLAEARAFAKPHPRSFELMETALADPGGRFVYVGDNPAKDFAAPNARGWVTVQVVREGGIHDATRTIEGGAAQHKVSALTELPKILDT